MLAKAILSRQMNPYLKFNLSKRFCHSERSEESMQTIDITGFFATLRMTVFDIFVKK